MVVSGRLEHLRGTLVVLEIDQAGAAFLQKPTGRPIPPGVDPVRLFPQFHQTMGLANAPRSELFLFLFCCWHVAFPSVPRPLGTPHAPRPFRVRR